MKTAVLKMINQTRNKPGLVFIFGLYARTDALRALLSIALGRKE
jgi:hypothetical protein